MYADQDGDGFVASSEPEYRCRVKIRPHARREFFIDCDDDNADVYPEASEVCDELDNKQW